MDGVLGDVLLVNGAPWPVLEPLRLRYRLRLLNASNARRYRLALDPPPPGGGGLVQIGGDGGLLERPLAHDTLDIAPAERFDVIVDFSRSRPGTRVRLTNRLGSGSTAHVMCFDVSTARPPADDSRCAELPRLAQPTSAAEEFDPGADRVPTVLKRTYSGLGGGRGTGMSRCARRTVAVRRCPQHR
ncbi:hypothetical protein ACWEO4_35320 [Streptomyces sp. NPDC004393]